MVLMLRNERFSLPIANSSVGRVRWCTFSPEFWGTLETHAAIPDTPEDLIDRSSKLRIVRTLNVVLFALSLRDVLLLI